MGRKYDPLAIVQLKQGSLKLGLDLYSLQSEYTWKEEGSH